jgi:hypothetical protein
MSDPLSLGGLLGGILGGAAGASSASSNNANAGHENMTTTTTQSPYGAASPYINEILSLGLSDLGPGSAAWGGTTPQGEGTPSYGGPGGVSLPQTTPLPDDPGGALNHPVVGGGGIMNNQNGGIVNGGTGVYADSAAAPNNPYAMSAPSGGSPGGGVSTSGVSNGLGLTGVSSSDEAAIQALMSQGQGITNNPLYSTDEGYINSLTSGGNPNSENAAAFSAASQLESTGNPALDQYISELFSGTTPGSSGPNPYMVNANAVGGGGGGGTFVELTPQQIDPTISNEASFIEKELGQNAYTANPAMNQEIAAATKSITDTMQQQTIPGITSAAVGSGLMGGSSWQNAMAQAANQESQNLGNTIGNLYGQDYTTQAANQMQAASIGAQINENQASNASQLAGEEAAAGTAAGASERAAALNYQLGMASLYQQGQLANSSDLESAIGLQGNIQQNALGQMGSLAQAYGNQQTAAAGLAPELAMMPSSIYNEAGTLSEGASRNAVSAQQAADQLKASLASTAAQRSAINLQAQEFYNPMTQLTDYSNIVHNLTGNLGSTTSNTQGTNFIGTPQQSVAGQGLAGALGGMNLGNMLGGALGGGNSSSNGINIGQDSNPSGQLTNQPGTDQPIYDNNGNIIGYTNGSNAGNSSGIDPNTGIPYADETNPYDPQGGVPISDTGDLGGF